MKSGIIHDKLLLEQIRNFCIIAHVDHGKSTLADWLISYAKLISETPGRRFLDSRKDEQERGITISSATISYVIGNNVFNLIDSPGHVDFGANVSTALRACDGALLLIDAVEGMMPQTVSVLKQAIAENVVPILVINKMDRLFEELRLTEEEIKYKISTLVKTVNQFIESLNPHYAIVPFSFKTGNIILSAGLCGWAINLAYSEYTLKHVLEYYNDKKQHELKTVMPLAECITSTIIDKCPNPKEGQKYKLDKIGQNLDSEAKQLLELCSPNDKLVGMVVGIQYSKEKGKIVSIRILSGSIKKGQTIYVGSTPMIVSRVCVNLGKNLEQFISLPAGMLAAVIGLTDVYMGATVSDDESFPPLATIKHNAEPVMTVSFVPKDQSKLAKLKELLIQQCIQDITLKYEFNTETKEHILKGLGKLHIEVVLNRVQREEKIELIIKEPTVIYLETTVGKSGIHEIVTSNKLNKFSISVDTLDMESIQVLKKYPNLLKVVGYQKLFPKDSIMDKYAKKIIAVEGLNILVDNTKSVQFMQESVPNVILGFRKAMHIGPILGKNVINTLVILQDANWHVDFVHRTPIDIAPPATKLIHSCMKEAEVRILEPYIRCYISIDMEYTNEISRQVKINKGRVIEIEYTSIAVIVHALIPVKNSFNLSEQFMKAAEGKVNWRYEPADYEPMCQSDADSLLAN